MWAQHRITTAVRRTSPASIAVAVAAALAATACAGAVSYTHLTLPTTPYV